MTEPGPGALAGLRVLDLSGHRAQLCARLLGDMGADVIKVEPPAGDDARRIGPFLDDLPHHDRSLFFWFYNLNKRSLTLDLKHSRGADILIQLARSADVVIESFAPGTMDQLGLGWRFSIARTRRSCCARLRRSDRPDRIATMSPMTLC